MTHTMFYRLRVWFRALARRATVEREMLGEIARHIELSTERLMARGLDPEEARAEAEREFGNVGRIYEQSRDARGVRAIENFLQDIRYAARGLRRTPSFTIGVVVTLALGVAANATMFRVVDRLLFRPPPYLATPDRSHQLYFARTVNGKDAIGEAYPYQRFVDLAETSTSMDLLVAFSTIRGEDTMDAEVAMASANLWRFFDATPVVGRFFTPAEDRWDGGGRVAVLSYDYWQTQFGGASSAIGQTVTIARNKYTIIGVTPRSFRGVAADMPAMFLPISVAAGDLIGPGWMGERTSYASSWFDLWGRRAPGVSAEAATAELTRAFAASYRRQRAAEPEFTPPIEVAKPHMLLASVLADRGPHASGESRVTAWLLAVWLIVLIIACANVGNLLLTRALNRRREIAVRLALGVSRGRLVRGVLAESALLALLGAGVGLIVAQLGGSFLTRMLMPVTGDSGVMADPRTLLFTLGVTAFIVLMSSAAPVAQLGHTDVIESLKSGGRGLSPRASRVRATLGALQVALSVILVVGAGLFVHSLERVAAIPLGYDAGNLLIVDLKLRGATFDSASDVALRYSLLDRARANPDVASVTLASSAPFSGARITRPFVDGMDSTSTFRLGEFILQLASPSYFATTGTRVLRGRGFTAADRNGAPRVVVVSDAVARALWPNQDAMGQCLRIASATAECRTVVGIAENIRQLRIDSDRGLEIYVPAAQGDEVRTRLIVRTRRDASAVAGPLRRDLATLMPAGGYVVVTPLSTTIAEVTRAWRLGAVMFSAFGALAAIVAAVGLYAVVSYGVKQRGHEIGIRMAHGARLFDVVRLVVGEALTITIVGVGIGISVAWLVAPRIGPLLFGISAHDARSYVGACTALLVATVVAALAPASRAARFDPAVALRAD
jgi:predicted permease